MYAFGGAHKTACDASQKTKTFFGNIFYLRSFSHSFNIFSKKIDDII